MKESAAHFERRTGVTYAPPRWLITQARPLAPREACPTLFRYPGPEGLRDALSGSSSQLAPAASDRVWLTSDVSQESKRAVRLFGSLAILEPLHLFPCVTRRRGVFLGVNRSVGDAAQVLWVPPCALGVRVAWDRLRSADDVARRFGKLYAEQRERITQSLSAYLEEMSGLERAGAPAPRTPWLAVSARDRRALLDEYGITPRWMPNPSAARP